jgi:hypothetical protein
MSVRAIVAALEALEAGDLAEAEAILLGALEDGPSARRYQCPVCPLRLEWPGQLEDHLLNVHGVAAAA